MKPHQIVAGLSDIKKQFKETAGIQKPMAELGVWFAFEEEVLYVHDADEHEKSMVLAVYNTKQEIWTHFLKSNSLGKRLIVATVTKIERVNLQAELNHLNDSHGFWPLK